ncbi:sensor histidine kinase [Neobacillus driksii]|uniref:sensor histidine kinase n=1 Tax=Neobacillus driksii TaxID=3035913 RepID=UPI0027D85D84|nr:histidine kinase [Neobacillus niacini]
MNNVVSKVSFYGDLLSEHILFLRTRQLQLFSDSDVEKLKFLGELVNGYEEVALNNSIKEELYMINNSSELVVNNGIFIESYNHAITVNNFQQDKSNEWDEISKKIDKSAPRPLYQINHKIFLIAMDKSENVISYIQLSEDKLIEKIVPIIDGKKDAGVFLVDDESNSIIKEYKTDQSIMNGILRNAAVIQKRKMINVAHEDPSSFVARINHNQYLVTEYKIKFLGMTLYTYINKKELSGVLSILSLGFLMLTLFSFVIVILFSWSVNRMLHKPLHKLVQLFKNYQENSKNQLNDIEYDAEFSYLYNSFQEMTYRLDQSIKENYQQKIEIQNSELKQLQSQINPHFLYNGFYSIYRLSKMKDLHQVTVLSQKLASYYQFITKNGNDYIELENEYKHAIDYCTIQEIRFSNRIQFFAPELESETKYILVPRLILQPILENAFEHAFENINLGVLKIEVNYVENELMITIEDNGNQLTDKELHHLQQRLSKPDEENEKTGIFNVCSRLKLRYGNESGLFASRSSLGGLKILMRIINKEG